MSGLAEWVAIFFVVDAAIVVVGIVGALICYKAARRRLHRRMNKDADR